MLSFKFTAFYCVRFYYIKVRNLKGVVFKINTNKKLLLK
ncbi:hypothetical protein QES_2741 [Clostridioides difficile CD149]|nr:hypothetical protein QAU_2538 [Clostridioides difficile CD13]EQE30557.1 hypothetical protein QC5_2540 [Clostridioides difficile CD34]EQE39242.1 hypothetical protein QCA_2697 [Clostridioides difficile CD40]EQE43183.1 hypothetical protein QCC_2258 [Clostridioides difficile CD41]EQE47829.1 hypothetical protein QCE_2562 [Clostridioides difficile CD42]EQE53201.1 hypothetical protein QCG_2695 [Clostridioides difficile CD43]EQE58255.1 hypothetical protein QCI_2481 [Clostridioides difficile CD44]